MTTAHRNHKDDATTTTITTTTSILVVLLLLLYCAGNRRKHQPYANVFRGTELSQASILLITFVLPKLVNTFRNGYHPNNLKGPSSGREAISYTTDRAVCDDPCLAMSQPDPMRQAFRQETVMRTRDMSNAYLPPPPLTRPANDPPHTVQPEALLHASR
jgi:hypothetical protein